MAAARDVFGESGADAAMEEIAARAGVGVGTVYRRFASKDALIDELLRLALADLLTDVRHALDRNGGFRLLTARAIAAGTVSADITVADVTALASGLRSLIHAGGEVSPGSWQRFLDLHLAGMRAPAT